MKKGIKELYLEHDINYNTVRSRLSRGYTLERALNEPTQKKFDPLCGCDNLVEYLEKIEKMP